MPNKWNKDFSLTANCIEKIWLSWYYWIEVDITWHILDEEVKQEKVEGGSCPATHHHYQITGGSFLGCKSLEETQFWLNLILSYGNFKVRITLGYESLQYLIAKYCLRCARLIEFVYVFNILDSLRESSLVK